ncbi:MAG: hypothetical protein DDT22_00784 [candidate division WS2 bacterium]|nr:hypothetical protein [Candidatus Lithacetigena glycinireducens]
MIKLRSRSELKELTTELLDGVTLGDSLFNSLLDTAQSWIEGLRPWVILRTVDETRILTSANTFQTEHNLPADFRRWYGVAPIALLDSRRNEVVRLREVPISQKNQYKDKSVFYANYRTRRLFVCGSYSQTFTIQQNYIMSSGAVSDNKAWVFPGEYSPILAYLVAVYFRESIDYDPLSAKNVTGVTKQIQAILANMFEWDDQLQLSATEGQDYTGDGRYSSEFGGSLRNLI